MKIQKVEILKILQKQEPGRYNSASGKLANADPNEVSIDRIQMTFGWFLTDNVVAKIEYVNQSYNDFAKNSIYSEGNFKGFLAEAAIGF